LRPVLGTIHRRSFLEASGKVVGGGVSMGRHMAKTPTTELVPAGKALATTKDKEAPLIDRMGEVVRGKYQAAMSAQLNANRLILDFAQSYARAHAEAHDLPGTLQQRRERKERLHLKIGIYDKSDSWRTNIRAIGESAPWMRRHAKHLPNSTEGLTLIAKNSEFAVTRLIDKGLLDEQSSISQTRSALGTPTKVTASFRQTYDATVSFNNQGDAVAFFVRTLRQSNGKVIPKDDNLRGRITGALGKADADKFKKRLV